MGDSEAQSDFPDRDQRLAFCQSEYDRAENMSQTVQVAANQTGTVRREMLEGQEHLVVPATLVQSQTLENNLGKTFLPEEEITDGLARMANNAPVILDHPQSRGQPISARQPGVINRQGAGRVFNARVEDGALKGDVFLNLERRDEVDRLDEVVEQAERGEPVELSTGLPLRKIENESGSDQNGRHYDKVIRPGGFDHLAVFTDKRGACSVSDGCGLGVNHDGSCETEDSDMNDADAENVADTVFNRIKNWFESEVQPEEGTMSEEQIAELSEATGLSEEHLEDMETEALQSLAENVLDADEESEESEEEPETAENSEEADIPEAVQNKLDRLESEVEALSAERREEKEGLVSTLAENERCPFGEDELEDFELDRLKGLAQMAKVRNYGGRGGPRTSENSDGTPDFMEPVPYYAENDEEED